MSISMFTDVNGEEYKLLTRRPDFAQYCDKYNTDEIRVALKLFYFLSPTHPIVIELTKAFHWLGKEWQDVFYLYANGYSLASITRYWHDIHGKDNKEAERNYGNRLIGRLTERIKFFLLLDEGDSVGPSSSKREQDLEQEIHNYDGDNNE